MDSNITNNNLPHVICCENVMDVALFNLES